MVINDTTLNEKEKIKTLALTCCAGYKCTRYKTNIMLIKVNLLIFILYITLGNLGEFNEQQTTLKCSK